MDKLTEFSESFYPFLHDNASDADTVTAGLRSSLMEKVEDSVTTKRVFFDANKDRILDAALLLARSFHAGKKLLVCGNGGSATDAQHIAVEFMHPITVGRKALPAICLNNDMATVTAVANDVAFADVFVRQLIALGKEGDVLIALSTSGNSENLLHAFKTARKLGISTIGFAGDEGGKMAEMERSGLIDHCFTVPTSSVHRIQESHLTLYHILWDLVHEYFQHRSLLESSGAAEAAV